MAPKKITGYVKLQITAAKATPAPPVGPALGQAQVNIMEFCKQFNERTSKDPGLAGMTVPVVITVYADRTFSFITKTPPAPVLLLKAAGIEKGLGHAEQRQKGQGHRKADPRDRQGEDAGHEREHRGSRSEDHSRHRPFDGHRRHRVSRQL